MWIFEVSLHIFPLAGIYYSAHQKYKGTEGCFLWGDLSGLPSQQIRLVHRSPLHAVLLQIKLPQALQGHVLFQ